MTETAEANQKSCVEAMNGFIEVPFVHQGV